MSDAEFIKELEKVIEKNTLSMKKIEESNKKINENFKKILAIL